MVTFVADTIFVGIGDFNVIIWTKGISSNNFKITVVVKADDVDVATITRNKGTSTTVAQTLLY